jgi:hypothetical protein
VGREENEMECEERKKMKNRRKGERGKGDE